MAIHQIQWVNINNHFRQSVLSLFDENIVPENIKEHDSYSVRHHGIYIGVVNVHGDSVCRLGSMDGDHNNLIESVKNIRKLLLDFVKEHKWTANMFLTSSLHYCVVLSSSFIDNPLNWNEQEDGIYFQWGDKYRGFYLPYEVQRMNVSKIEVLNRLCTWEAKVPANLWRLPEGLCFKLVCDSYSAFD